MSRTKVPDDIISLNVLSQRTRISSFIVLYFIITKLFPDFLSHILDTNIIFIKINYEITPSVSYFLNNLKVSSTIANGNFHNNSPHELNFLSMENLIIY